MDWIEWMWRVDVESICGKWKVESGAVPDLTSVKFYLSCHQRITWRGNIAENFNRLSRVHERYRQTTDRQKTDRRQTDGRRHIANVNMSSRSLKSEVKGSACARLKASDFAMCKV